MNADAHLNLDALSQARLKDAMGSFVTGVTVVAAHFEGVDFGMTCNSFNTVSLEPPLVLWSVQRTAGSYRAFREGGGYSVSILSDRQTDLVAKFAKGSQEDRFAGVPLTRLDSGRLVLEEAVAWFDCVLEQAVEAGDHDVLIGRVLDFGSNPGRGPVGYVRGQFTPMRD